MLKSVIKAYLYVYGIIYGIPLLIGGAFILFSFGSVILTWRFYFYPTADAPPEYMWPMGAACWLALWYIYRKLAKGIQRFALRTLGMSKLWFVRLRFGALHLLAGGAGFMGLLCMSHLPWAYRQGLTSTGWFFVLNALFFAGLTWYFWKQIRLMKLVMQALRLEQA